MIQQHNEGDARPEDFSLKNFIEEGKRNEIKKKNKVYGRKTAEENPDLREEQNRISYSFSDKKEVDIRGENILKLQRFIKGGEVNDDDLSEYVSLREMEKSCHNYGIFESMHRKIKKSLTKEKVNPRVLKEQSVKNVIYLNENIKQETNMEKKK